MRIVVLGAGALGAYFGARWMETGVDVTFWSEKSVQPKYAKTESD